MHKRTRCAAITLLLSIWGQAGCSSGLASDLPGSAQFPLVAGSNIERCPPEWLSPDLQQICVAAPNDDNGRAIVDRYKQILSERGFRFGRYLDSPSVVMLVRPNGNECDLMIFGLPYLPPEQRTRLLLMFALQQTSAVACAQVEREGRG